MLLKVKSKYLKLLVDKLSIFSTEKNPCVCFEANTNSLKISLYQLTNKMENFIDFILEAEVLEEGRAVVELTSLKTMFKNKTNEFLEISFKYGDDKTIIKDKVNYKLKSYNTCEIFDDLFKHKILDKTFLDIKTFTEKLSNVKCFCDKNNMKYSLNGVFVNIKPNKINFVATDSRKLAIEELESNFEYNNEKGFIVHNKSIECLEFLEKTFKDENIKISFNDKRMNVFCDKFNYTFDFIDDVYPNYEKIIFKTDNETKKSELNSKELLDILSLFKIGYDRVNFSFKDNELKISNENFDNIEIEKVIEVKSENNFTFITNLSSIIKSISFIEDFEIYTQDYRTYILKSKNRNRLIIIESFK